MKIFLLITIFIQFFHLNVSWTINPLAGYYAANNLRLNALNNQISSYSLPLKARKILSSEALKKDGFSKKLNGLLRETSDADNSTQVYTQVSTQNEAQAETKRQQIKDKIRQKMKNRVLERKNEQTTTTQSTTITTTSTTTTTTTTTAPSTSTSIQLDVYRPTYKDFDTDDRNRPISNYLRSILSTNDNDSNGEDEFNIFKKDENSPRKFLKPLRAKMADTKGEKWEFKDLILKLRALNKQSKQNKFQNISILKHRNGSKDTSDYVDKSGLIEKLKLVNQTLNLRYRTTNSRPMIQDSNSQKFGTLVIVNNNNNNNNILTGLLDPVELEKFLRAHRHMTVDELLNSNFIRRIQEYFKLDEQRINDLFRKEKTEDLRSQIPRYRVVDMRSEKESEEPLKYTYYPNGNGGVIVINNSNNNNNENNIRKILSGEGININNNNPGVALNLPREDIERLLEHAIIVNNDNNNNNSN